MEKSILHGLQFAETLRFPHCLESRSKPGGTVISGNYGCKYNSFSELIVLLSHSCCQNRISECHSVSFQTCSVGLQLLILDTMSPPKCFAKSSHAYCWYLWFLEGVFTSYLADHPQSLDNVKENVTEANQGAQCRM